MLENKQFIRRGEADASGVLKRNAASAIVDNAWVHILDASELTIEQMPNKNCSVPYDFWQEHKEALAKLDYDVAVQIAADAEIYEIAEQLIDQPLIVLTFASYVDGRSYSHAYLLRTRYGYTGEIRAVGQVHFDHLDFLARCGVNSFELPEGHDLTAAVTAFDQFSEVYQPSADDGRLIFSKRRAVH
ncbi:MAG: DUF934 domain-containing protein [Arenicella sp.]